MDDNITYKKAACAPLTERMLLLDMGLSAEYKKKLDKISKLLKIKVVNEFM